MDFMNGFLSALIPLGFLLICFGIKEDKRELKRHQRSKRLRKYIVKATSGIDFCEPNEDGYITKGITCMRPNARPHHSKIEFHHKNVKEAKEIQLLLIELINECCNDYIKGSKR